MFLDRLVAEVQRPSVTSEFLRASSRRSRTNERTSCLLRQLTRTPRWPTTIWLSGTSAASALPHSSSSVSSYQDLIFAESSSDEVPEPGLASSIGLNGRQEIQAPSWTIRTDRQPVLINNTDLLSCSVHIDELLTLRVVEMVTQRFSGMAEMVTQHVFLGSVSTTFGSETGSSCLLSANTC